MSYVFPRQTEGRASGEVAPPTGGGEAKRWSAETSVLIVLAALAALVVLIVAPTHPAATQGNDNDVLQYAFVIAFSGAVGFAELIARYRDNPSKLLGASAAILYVVVNAAAGVGALVLAKELQVFAKSDHKKLYEALLASFGAIAFFRTSLFTAKVGDQDVGIGPSTLLQSFLTSCDRMTDRGQACDRAASVSVSMRDVDFTKASKSLPSLCFTLVEGMTAEEQKNVGEQIKKLIEEKEIDNDSKTKILGVYLIRTVGALVLEQAVKTLGASIKRAEPEIGGRAPNAAASPAGPGSPAA